MVSQAIDSNSCLIYFKRREDIENPNNPGLVIAFGHLDQNSPLPESSTVRSISEVISHPDYKNINNDIALLKLSTPVDFTNNLRPVCINSDEDEYNTYQTTQQRDACWVVGWGAIESGGRFNSKCHSPVPLVFQSGHHPVYSN